MKLDLTPVQAKILFNVCDGQADAGACKGGNTPQEQRTLNQIMDKLLKGHKEWREVRLDEN